MALHEAITHAITEVDYECEYCGYACTAIVRAKGSGMAMSFIGVDRGHARREASQVAEAEAAHQAKVTMSLVPCLQCGRRSRAALASFVIESAIPVVISIAMAAALWWLATPWWAVAFTLVVAAGLVWQQVRRFSAAATHVLSARPRATTLPVAKVVTQPKPIAASSSRVDEHDPGAGPRMLR